MKNRESTNCNGIKSPALKVALAAASVLLLGCAAPVRGGDNRAPEVPASLAVPDGNKVAYHAYAVGVQIYRWSGTAWVFIAPEAVLYDTDGDVAGIHYVGPTWESNSGSKVVGARVAGATVDSTAIPWLLLRTVSAEGPGIFHRVTFIQRVNTAGGKAPAAPGSVVGEEANVPYTAEYFFYRATN